MRHRLAGKTLGRNTKQRASLYKNLISELIVHGQIETTEARAKAVHGLADKLIHRAGEGTVSARRVLASFFGKRELVNRLVDVVAPAMKGRVSGFTRIVRLGNRRGDDTMMVRMELTQQATNNKQQTTKSAEKSVEKIAGAKTAPVAKKKKAEK